MAVATAANKQAVSAAGILADQNAYTPQEARDNIPPGTRVKVIVNPASGKKGGITTNAAGVDDVRRVLEANGIQADVVETEHAGHATELAREAVEQGYDVVVACGGDGTVSEVARALIRTRATLGILPLGSANNVARMMHVPFALDEAAKVLRTGEPVQADVGRCNGEFFLETAGVGLDAALFPILNRVDKGDYIRLIDAARTFFRYRPHRMTLLLDKRAVTVRALMVLVANGPYWGYSVPLAPDALVDDRKLDVVVFRNFSKLGLIKHIITALLHRARALDPNSPKGRKSPIYHPDIITYKARQIRVLTRRHLHVHADAQPRGYTPAEIRVVPAALRVITGPGEHVTAEPSAGTPQGEPPEHRLEG